MKKITAIGFRRSSVIRRRSKALHKPNFSIQKERRFSVPDELKEKIMKQI